MALLTAAVLIAWVGWTTLTWRYLALLRRITVAYHAHDYAPDHEHSLFDVTEVYHRRYWVAVVYLVGCAGLALLWWWQRG